MNLLCEKIDLIVKGQAGLRKTLGNRMHDSLDVQSLLQKYNR